MLMKNTRAVLLGSVASLVVLGAHAQTVSDPQAEVSPEACAILADQLAAEAALEPEIRAEVEAVIATGDLAQCNVVITAWETEGAITRESLELVAREQVSERMIVQQEVQVDADVAVYQPPAEVQVDSGAPEVLWSMPRQSVTVDEQAPQITVRQAQPVVHVEVPQPRVTVIMPEPEVIVTWPDSTLAMAEQEPVIEVRIPEPLVSVSMPDPVIELTIGGSGPSDLVELPDGRFAPQGATEADLQPRITLNQAEATIAPGTATEQAEVIFNRADPVVTLEGEDPQVTVEVVGEPEIVVSTSRQPGGAQPEGAAPTATE